MLTACGNTNQPKQEAKHIMWILIPFVSEWYQDKLFSKYENSNMKSHVDSGCFFWAVFFLLFEKWKNFHPKEGRRFWSNNIFMKCFFIRKTTFLVLARRRRENFDILRLENTIFSAKTVFLQRFHNVFPAILIQNPQNFRPSAAHPNFPPLLEGSF